MADDTIKVDILTDSTSSTKSMITYAAAIGTATLAVNKIINVSKDLIKSYRESEQASAKLEATLKATGNAAGFSLSQLKDYASSLQDITTYDDDVITSGLAVLATFKSIQGDAFKRTTEAALDLSAVMGQDLQSSMVQLGKAVENPTVGLTALSRVGVTFTDQEKEQIKTLQESNNLREAQSVILKAVEGQFKGAAQALANTPTGKLDQLNNAIGDLKEALGAELVMNTAPFAEWLKEVAERSTKALTETRKLADFFEKGITTESVEDLDLLIEQTRKRIEGLYRVISNNKNTPDATLKAYNDQLENLNILVAKKNDVIKQGEEKEAAIVAESNQKKKEDQEKYLAEQLEIENAKFAASLEANAAYWTAKTEEEVVWKKAIDDRNKADETAKQEEKDRAKEHFEALTEYYEGYTAIMTDTFAALGERMGESIIEQESMWDATGEIIKGAIAGIIRAIGSEAFVQAAKSMAQAFAWMSIPGGQAYAGKAFAAAAKWTAAGTMANVAAGMVNAKFAQGGEFITSGPQAIMVGDNATGRERVKVEPLGNESGQSGMIHNVIVLDGRPIADFITRASKDGRIITSARSVR